eukprot:scaffold402783_cov20-Attheya_sp.AAC.1
MNMIVGTAGKRLVPSSRVGNGVTSMWTSAKVEKLNTSMEKLNTSMDVIKKTVHRIEATVATTAKQSD